MSVPKRIKDLANKVRNEIYGKDVRESIAQSMEVTGETAEEAKERSLEQTDRVDTLIRENPQPSEVVDARGNFDILRDRLNSSDQQLAQTTDSIGLSSSSYNSLQEAINDAILKGEQLVINGHHTLNAERLLVDEPVTIVFSNNAFFTQTEFAYPIFEVRSKGVKFYGKLRAENTGTSYHITSTEITNRGLTVPVEVSNDPKGYSAVIACIQNVDDLYIEHVEGKNFVTTISFLSSVSTDVNYSDNVKVEYAYGEEQWVTVLGGGFLFAEFGTIVGKRMVWSQGVNPNHVLYLGMRMQAHDKKVFVDKVIAYDCPDMNSIVSAKTIEEFVCGDIVGYGAHSALVTSYGESKIGRIKGFFTDNVSRKTNLIKSDLGARTTVGEVDVTTDVSHDDVLASNSVLSCVGEGSTLEIFNLNLKLTSETPMRAIRTSAKMKIHKANIEYLNPPTVAPILGEGSQAELYIYEPPVVTKHTDSLIQLINVKDYKIVFNPNLVDGNINDSTIVINNNDFSKLLFTDFNKTPTEEPNIGTSYNLRARNVLKLRGGQNTVNILNRGSHMQEYLLVAGDDGTSPQIAHGSGNIFLKSNNNYPANSWKVLRFICIDDNFHEI